jgi:predicted ATPase
VRQAFARYSGYEVDYEGDAFFYTFSSAQQAVTAVSEAMQGLEEGPIKIRVGIHTGSPELDPPKYVGMDVHTAARIMSCGHGGQVVVSQTTAALVETPLTELGEHRLKDIAEAVPLYQLGEGSFPPLKTISNTNLPRPASSFVGRERETEEVVSLLKDSARIVTLSGPGGSGKTRLSIEAASELVPDFKAGVFWIGLATLRDPALVTETIAQTLGAKDGLAEHIAERELLLLIDNLEQVIDCAPELGSLLEACPNLKLLVTSRELLRIRGEVEYAVPPLSDREAVELFCERSQLQADETIAELCRRLDNLPLAVELAAARTSVLTPEQILERLSQRLDLLKGGRDAEARQQTLRATIEWSYELLTPEEQLLFARLSVFAGGCTLAAAEEVADADLDTLQSLVDKSLLRFSEGRYWMLETIREYAGERLERSAETHNVAAAHAGRFARLASELAGPLRRYSADALETHELERENMRAALEFALQRDNVVLASDLLDGLWFRWLASGGGGEARMWADRYLTTSRHRVEPLDRFLGDLAVAEILRFAGDAVAAIELKRELVATARAHPNVVVRGVATERSLAATLSDLSYLEVDLGRLEQARADADEALALRRRLGIPNGIAHALIARGMVSYNEHDFSGARERYAEAARISERAQAWGDAVEAGFGQAECELLLGRLEEAKIPLRAAFAQLRTVADETLELHGLRVAAMLAAAKGDSEHSAVLFGAIDERLRQGGLTYFGPREQQLQLAYVERARQDLGEAGFRNAYQRGVERSDIGLDFALALADAETA